MVLAPEEMHIVFKKCLFNRGLKSFSLYLLMPLLFTLLASCQVNTPLPSSPSPIGYSQFSPGITLVDTSLNFPEGNNDLAAVDNVKSLIKQAIPYINTPIMAWGVGDPWPDPSQPGPTNWDDLDKRLQLAVQTGGIPVITLAEAPWWMKGQLQADGSTRLITKAEEWSDVAYAARILDNRMNAWLLLVQRIAERYMAAPYNVRYFQVWNELKGYYNPITNTYDYSDGSGNPAKPDATHGYTYMYNVVYNRLMSVAASLHIPASSIKVGGPYVPIATWSSTSQSNPSHITKAYGTYDQRSLDVLEYWLQHKEGAGFITLDGANLNEDHIADNDAFIAAEKFADMTRWIRSLNSQTYPGATTLPVWWAEWYATPYTPKSDDLLNNAIKTYAMMKLLQAGGAVALSWGGLGDGMSDRGLWTPTTRGGGQPLAWYYSYQAFTRYFPPGTPFYNVTLSLPGEVAALASTTNIMLVNKTDNKVTLAVDSMTISLDPYQVRIISA